MITFANRLRTLLETHARTQADLVRFLNVRPNTVSAWCTGRALPQLATIERIAEFFKVSTAHLLVEATMTETAEAAPPAPDPPAAPEPDDPWGLEVE